MPFHPCLVVHSQIATNQLWNLFLAQAHSLEFSENYFVFSSQCTDTLPQALAQSQRDDGPKDMKKRSMTKGCVTDPNWKNSLDRSMQQTVKLSVVLRELCMSGTNQTDHTNLSGAHLSYALFSFWHAVSHVLPSAASGEKLKMQMHALTYVMGIATTAALAQGIGLPRCTTPAGLFWYIATAVSVITDVYVFFFVRGVWLAFTGLIATTIMVGGPIPLADQATMRRFLALCAGVAAVIGVEMYEVMTCDEAAASQTIPLHAALETTGLMTFFLLSCFVSTASGKKVLSPGLELEK